MKEASLFLVESVVPRFVRDCIQLAVTPIDGEALTMAMHARGINMRYLGEVAALAALREDLEHLRVRPDGVGVVSQSHVILCPDSACV